MPRHATTAAAIAVFLVTLAVPDDAHANFHFMKVREVYPGSVAAPNAQYIELQMYSGGQNVVMGRAVTVFSANGTQVGTFAFPANVASGANQATILVATTEATTFFGVTPDHVMTAVLPLAGGKVCFDSIDCVAWGAYTGPAGTGGTAVGTPAVAATGLVRGRALTRRLNVAGGATTLEAADDTNVSANDFVLAIPAPRNNAGVAGTIPPSTCGNGMVESLEGCDDSNTTSNDGCSATCEPDVAAVDAGVPDADPAAPDADVTLPDAAPPADASDAPDATAGAADASAVPDASSGGTPVSDSDGCGCRVGARAARDVPPWAALLALALVLLRRRRP